MVSLGSLSEGFEAWAVVVPDVLLWQSAGQTGGVCVGSAELCLARLRDTQIV